MPLNEFKLSISISAPISEVWEKLVDWKSQSEWMALTHVWSSADHDGKSGVGTVIEAFTGIGKFGVLDQMKVVEWKPPTFCAVNHFGRFIKGIGEFRLVELSPSETRFDWYERIDAPRWLLALIRPGILVAVKFSLSRFARSVRR
ncbi:MAG: hypothetical protein RL202_805 [Actinomycetota bacterium]|jgi:hypothetical protein